LWLYTISTEPTGNRAYAETWKQALTSELLQVQGQPQHTAPRSDGVLGTVYRYHIGPWRGMKGRIYPGTMLGALIGNRSMASGLYHTAPAGAYCTIDFIANDAGVIEAINYSGTDCG
jgi:hypothetical protein